MIDGTVAVGFLDPGEWSACFGLSLQKLYLHDLAHHGRIIPRGEQIREFCSTGGIPAGRNTLAADFLDRTTCEWLFMVDSDMGFAADTVERLIDAADADERPVVGGLCFQLKGDGISDLGSHRFRCAPTVCSFHEFDNEVGFRPIADYPRDELVACSATGGACLLLHRGLLERMRERYGPVWFDPVTHPKGKGGAGTTFSEDFSFCVRLAALDVQLYVHTGIKTTHHKGGVYLDEELFDRQQRGSRADALVFFGVLGSLWASPLAKVPVAA